MSDLKVISALGVSILADVREYAGMPLFAMPVIGDITDGIVISLLYSITKSKVSTAMNFIELIPFIGDLIPTYPHFDLDCQRKKQKKEPNN